MTVIKVYFYWNVLDFVMKLNFEPRFLKFQTTQLAIQYGDDRIKLFFATILANFLVGCSAIMSLVLIIFSAFSVKLLEGKSFLVFLPIQIFLLSMLLVSYSLLLKGRYNIGRDAFTSTVIGIIFVSIMITGGFPGSVATPCLILPPIITFMLYGKSAGIKMTIAVPALVSFQWVAVGFGGIDLPDFTSQITPAANIVLVILVAYFVTVSIVATYEFQNRILRDELADEQEKLSELAIRDPLTELYNSRHFHSVLENRIEQANFSEQMPVLIYLDLDRFKPINDLHGHQVGDDVLRIVAARMTDNVRDMDVVARMGGDEFAIMIWGIENENEIAETCERLRLKISAPIILNDVRHEVGASVGYSIISDKDNSIKYHLKIADQSMYRDKSQKVARKLIANKCDQSSNVAEHVGKAA